jgi:hypothetical protein
MAAQDFKVHRHGPYSPRQAYLPAADPKNFVVPIMIAAFSVAAFAGAALALVEAGLRG